MKINQFLDALEHVPSYLGAKNNSYIDSEILFQSLVNNELKRQVGSNFYDKATYVIDQYFKSLQLCRNNELSAAHKQLEFSDSLFLHLPSSVTDYVTLYKQSTWSNYSYKMQMWDAAIEQIRYGLSISAKLEKCGYEAFMYRRIGQLYNINTIYYKQNMYDTAHELLKNKLIFLCSGTSKDMLIKDWNIEIIRKIKALHEGALDGVFNTLATQNISQIRSNIYNDEYHYKYYFKLFLNSLEVDTYNRVILYNWLYTKASYFEEGLEKFLDNSYEFLIDNDNIPEYDILKANLLVQIIFYAENNLTNSKIYSNSIKLFAHNILRKSTYKLIENF